jgi:hypothetical protein
MKIGSVFELLERLGMGFPKGRLSKDGGMNAKVTFVENTSFILRSSTGKVTKGK